MLSPGSFGHGGAWGTQAWIDPVKGVSYIRMIQRSNLPNSDGSEIRRVFQEAAARALREALRDLGGAMAIHGASWTIAAATGMEVRR